MDGAFDIPDSTDWLNTPLKDLSTLENALHCQICKEFYDTPMITSCAHTFCSKCIRTSLSADGKCPACRASDQASKLRNNWALQEVVSTFLAARPAALEVARREQEAKAQSRKPGKRKRAVMDSDDIAEAEQESRTTRSKSRRLAASQTSEQEVIEVGDSDGEEDRDFAPDEAQEDGLVECPLGCGKRMKIEAVEPHLDRCEDEKRQASKSKSNTPVNVFGHNRPPPLQEGRPQERISELNSSLYNETKLAKKLRELGIPSSGPKQLMIKRHTEWVNIWNANCDSNQPRSKRELLRDLDAWERTQGGKAPNGNGLSSSVMRKDFDGAGWANKNKDDFSRLIAEAQRRKNNPATEPERSKNTDAAGEEPGAPGADFVASDRTDESGQPAADTPATSQPEQTRSIRPYEDSPEALSSIREKVDALNAGRQVEPVMNSGFENPTNGNAIGVHGLHASDSENLPGVENPALMEQSHFGELRTSPAKKMPMFAMPSQPVMDVDTGGDGHDGH